MTRMPVMTTQELRSLVWTKSLEAAAVDLQLSNSGLRKVCRRHSIAVPSALHWDKGLGRHLRHFHRTRVRGT